MSSSAVPGPGQPEEPFPPAVDVPPGLPAPPPVQRPAATPYVLTIGDIGVTSDNIVVTPNGSAPLRETRWLVLDQSVTTQVIPTYAIVLAIVFALLCLLGLLFLLVKEDRTTGYVLVTVTGPGLQHSTQVPVSSPFAVAQVRSMVAQAQSMATRA